MENEMIWSFLHISLSTSLVIGLLLLVTPLLRKNYQARWRYYAWLVIAIRLLVPLNISLPEAPIQIQVPETAIEAITQPDRPIAGQELPIADEGLVAVPSDIRMDKEVSLTQVVMVVWIFGVVMFFFLQTTAYIRFRRRIRYSPRTKPSTLIRNIWAASAELLGIRRVPELQISSAVPSPVITGLIKPALFLPHEQYSEQELSFIFRHELVHYQYKDLWYKLILTLANGLHWFNPLIYLMVARAGMDIEISCDDRVVKGLDDSARSVYGKAILDSLPIKSKWSIEPMLTTSFSRTKRTIKQRLTNLFDQTRKRNGVVTFCVMLLVTGLIGGLIAYTPVSAASTTLDSPNSMATAKIGSRTWYLVETEAQLRSIALSDTTLSLNYLQNADVVLENDWVSIGSDEHPFTGSYNGNGFTIVGLRYPIGEKKYTGLFGYAEGAEIYNVTLAKLDTTNANGLHSGAVVAISIGGDSFDNTILSDEQFKSVSSALPDSLIDSYYLAVNDPVYSYLQNNSIKKFLDMWFAEDIDKNVKPQWNYNSLAPVQILDHNFASLIRPEVQLYTMTFTVGGNRCGYILLAYSAEGPSIQKWNLIETTPHLYDLRANSEKITANLKETSLDLSTTTARRIEWQDTKRNRGDRIILFEDGKGNRYICYLGDDNFTMEKV